MRTHTFIHMIVAFLLTPWMSNTQFFPTSTFSSSGYVVHKSKKIQLIKFETKISKENNNYQPIFFGNFHHKAHSHIDQALFLQEFS